MTSYFVRHKATGSSGRNIASGGAGGGGKDPGKPTSVPKSHATQDADYIIANSKPASHLSGSRLQHRYSYLGYTSLPSIADHIIGLTREYIKRSLKQGKAAEEAFVVGRPLRNRDEIDMTFRDPTRRINLTRADYRVPIHAHARGTVNANPCSKCDEEHGPFAQCVSLQGYFDGVCTNCAFGRSRKDARCSLVQSGRASALPSRGTSTTGGSRAPTTGPPDITLPASQYLSLGYTTNDPEELEWIAEHLRRWADNFHQRSKAIYSGERVPRWPNDVKRPQFDIPSYMPTIQGLNDDDVGQYADSDSGDANSDNKEDDDDESEGEQQEQQEQQGEEDEEDTAYHSDYAGPSFSRRRHRY